MSPTKQIGVKKKSKDPGENEDSFSAEESPLSSSILVESDTEEEEDVVLSALSSGRKQNAKLNSESDTEEEEDVVLSALISSGRKPNAKLNSLKKKKFSPSSSSPTSKKGGRSLKKLNDSVELLPEKNETQESIEVDSENENTDSIESANEDTEKSGDNESLEEAEIMEVDCKTKNANNSNAFVVKKIVESSKIEAIKNLKNCRVRLVYLRDAEIRMKVKKPHSTEGCKMDIEKTKFEVELPKALLEGKHKEQPLSSSNVSSNEIKNSITETSAKMQIETVSKETCKIRFADKNLTDNASSEIVCKTSFSNLHMDLMDSKDIDMISVEETIAEVDENANEETTKNPKTEVNKNAKIAATPKTEVDKNAKSAGTSKTEVDKNRKPVATSKSEVVMNEKISLGCKIKVNTNEKTEVEKSRKAVAASESGVDMSENQFLGFQTKTVTNEKAEAGKSRKLVATSKPKVDMKKKLSVSCKTKMMANEKAEVEKSKTPVATSKSGVDMNEKLSLGCKTKMDKNEKPLPSKTEADKNEKPALLSQTKTGSDRNEKPAPLSQTKKGSDKNEKPAPLSQTKKGSDKKEKRAQPSETKTRSDKNEKPAPPSQTKTGSDKKEKPTQPSQTKTGSDSQKNVILGRSFIIGTRGAAQNGKNTLFDCVLCFSGEEKYGVPGVALNQHINTKEHALNVMEVENQNLYKKFKDNPNAKSEDIFKAVFEYEETQEKQTLVLASKENYPPLRQYLVKKIASIKKCNAEPDILLTPKTEKTTKTSSKPSNLATASPILSKSNKGVVSSNKPSSANSVNVTSKKETLITAPVEKDREKVPVALSTLSFLSSLQKKDRPTQNEKKTGKKDIQNEKKTEKIMKVLVVGDSEVAVFKDSVAELERKFLIKLRTSFKAGRSILKSEGVVKEYFRRDTDVLFLFGLSSLAWKEAPLDGAPDVSLITQNRKTIWGEISVLMKKITNHCTSVNPDAIVYLILPSVKNIYQLNLLTLQENFGDRFDYLRSLMDEDILFKHSSLVEMSREIYSMQLEIKDSSKYSWDPKNILMIHHGFNHYFGKVLNGQTGLAPHTQFLKGQSDEFQLVELIHDGFHYTSQCIESFFEAIKGKCRWLKHQLIPNGSSVDSSTKNLSIPSPYPVIPSVEATPKSAISHPSNITPFTERHSNSLSEVRPGYSRNRVEPSNLLMHEETATVGKANLDPQQNQMINILVIGDSEVTAFKNSAVDLQGKFNIKLRFNFKGGRSILESESHVKQEFTKNTDILFLFGLSSFAWKKAPLDGAPDVTLLTQNREANWDDIPVLMRRITHYCSQVNPSGIVYLILPSVKNIYQFNRTTLQENYGDRFNYLRKLMDEDILFSNSSLIEMSRKVFSKQLAIKDNKYSWDRKNILKIHDGFNYFVNYILNRPTRLASHSKFLNCESDEFQFVTLIHDGFHYTDRCIESFFEAIRFSCSWLKFQPNPLVDSSTENQHISSSSSQVLPSIGATSELSRSRPSVIPEKGEMMNILVVGDSEVAAFKNSRSELESKFFIKICTNFKEGRSILESEEAVKQAFTTNTDVLFLLGLTSFAWRKVSLKNSQDVTLLTKNQTANWDDIPVFMERITHICTKVNPRGLVYLILPTVKNIYQFNLKTIQENQDNFNYLLSVMDRDDRFTKSSLAKMSRDVYWMQLTIKDSDNYSWDAKKILMMNHGVNNFFRNVIKRPTRLAPHSKFLKSKSDEFEIVELIDDGLHYTPQCIESFFEANRYNCRWLKRRPKANYSSVDSSTKNLPIPSLSSGINDFPTTFESRKSQRSTMKPFAAQFSNSSRISPNLSRARVQPPYFNHEKVSAANMDTHDQIEMVRNKFMNVRPNKDTFPKPSSSNPPLSNTDAVREKLKELLEKDKQPVITEDAVKKMMTLLMSCTEGGNVEKLQKTEETTVSDKYSTSYDVPSSTQTVIKVWNFSDSIPEKFFDFLFKSIDSKSDLEKVVENNEWHYLVKLSKVSATLIVGKLDNIFLGDSTLRVSLIHSHEELPQLTPAQENYISSIFNDIYSCYKPQIITNIKNKLIDVTDFTNYKTEKCDGSCHGDKANCNFYHSSDDRRRNPMRYTYIQNMCVSPDTCARGDLCSSAHNIYEQLFYPTNFQKILCPMHDKNNPLTDGFCKFAHKNSPEMFFTESWSDIVTFGSQNSLLFLVGAIRAIHKLSRIKDTKICFITESSEFLEMIFNIIDEIAFSHYRLKCVNLVTRTHANDEYNVYFGTPVSIYHYSGMILSERDYGVLIVDNIKGIMEDFKQLEYLMKICQRFNISPGRRSPINKVFVSSTYDPRVTDVVSRYLGIPMQEVKGSDIPQSPKLCKSTASESGKYIVRTSSRSRSVSPSRRSRSQRSISKLRSRRSASRSHKEISRPHKRQSRSRSPRRNRSPSRMHRSPSRMHRSRSRSRRIRSPSRFHRSRSRSLKNQSSSRQRKSMSPLVSKSRKRSASKSRRSRSKTVTRRMSSAKSHKKQLSPFSRSLRNRSKSPKSSKAKKRPVSPDSPPNVSKMPRLYELSTKVPQNVFSPQTTSRSSSKALGGDINVPSVETLGEKLYQKFTKKKSLIQESIEEEFETYKSFPELHPNYEVHYEEFSEDYYKTYGVNTKEQHKEVLWLMCWSHKVKGLKEVELSKKLTQLEKEFLQIAQSRDHQTEQKTPSVSFSVENALNLLEELSPNLGMIGPAIAAIINSARKAGVTTREGLSLIADKESLALLKMVIEKLYCLQTTSPNSLLPILIRGVEWTQKLIEVAENPQKAQGYDLMAIAKASLGKDSGFTINLIKEALSNEGLPYSKERITQAYLDVCAYHFEMELENK